MVCISTFFCPVGTWYDTWHILVIMSAATGAYESLVYENDILYEFSF